MKMDFICPSCGNNWSQKSDKRGLFNGCGFPSCPICGTLGRDPKNYGDFVCPNPNCRHKWRNYGNGGLVLGCWPNCPKCGTLADEP